MIIRAGRQSGMWSAASDLLPLLPLREERAGERRVVFSPRPIETGETVHDLYRGKFHERGIKGSSLGDSSELLPKRICASAIKCRITNNGTRNVGMRLSGNWPM